MQVWMNLRLNCDVQNYQRLLVERQLEIGEIGMKHPIAEQPLDIAAKCGKTFETIYYNYGIVYFV